MGGNCRGLFRGKKSGGKGLRGDIRGNKARPDASDLEGGRT